LVKPSPSASADGLFDRTVKVLAGVGIELELPTAVVATTVNDPIADGVRLSDIVAEVPSTLMVTFDGVINGGTTAGKNEKLAPERLNPVT
jgi:hypothetical protein